MRLAEWSGEWQKALETFSLSGGHGVPLRQGTGPFGILISTFHSFWFLLVLCFHPPVFSEPSNWAVCFWGHSLVHLLPLHQQLGKAFLLKEADEPRNLPYFKLNQPSNYS